MQYDKEGKGSLHYEPLVALILDKEHYPLYMDEPGTTQAKAAAEEAASIQQELKFALQAKAAKLRQV